MERAAVPKAAVDKHRNFLPSKHKIRRSGNRLSPTPSYDSVAPQKRHHAPFGALVAAGADGSHDFGAFLPGKNVCHCNGLAKTSSREI